MSRTYAVATASLTAENTFTDHIFAADKPDLNALNLSISGLTDSTVTVQVSYDSGTTWFDIAQYTSTDAVNGCIVKVIEGCGEGVAAYRVGIKTGDYGTDTVVCRLSQ